MSEIADRYRRLSQAFADKIAGVSGDGWDAATPCPEWSVRDLVQHVVDTQGMFLGFVSREMPPLPSAANDPAGAWDEARGVIQADLDDPDRAGEEFDGFFGRTRWDEAVDRFLNTDLVIHGWDLARATGQDEAMNPEDVSRVQAVADGFGDNMRAPGAFGPAVEAPADADAQTKLLAYVGRKV